MAYKLKINNDKVYNIKDGFSIKEELNETLDSGIVQFTTYHSEGLDAVSFDSAEIYEEYDNISKKTLLVDSIDDEIFSFGSDINNCDHSYTVSIFSDTKILERITLPNCSVTQPLSGTKKTVYDEIDRFCQLYLPKIKVYDDNETLGYKYVDEFDVDIEVFRKFRSIECPEFQWNEPTLREVLNDLMSTADCIVVVKNKKITYYDLKEKGSPIDITKLSYSKKTMSSADYCGELTLNMQNAIGKNVTTVCEKKGLRTNSGELTTSNAMFIAQKPIYNIKSCKISYFIHSREGSAPLMKYYKGIDITDYIVEKDVYDVANSARYNPAQNIDAETAKGYKHYLLYYKRGSNTIEGWGETMKPDTVSSAVSHIGWIVYLLDKEAYPRTIGSPSDGFAWKNIDDSKDIRGIHVDLTYETVSGHSIHVGKYLPIRHPDNRIFDNQSNSYVDANNQSIFEYAKVNRLGNKIRTIQGEFTNESDIPQLGDYIGDEILFSKEVVYYDDILYFKGMLTPNYVLKDYFTGVRAKKRSWQLAKEEDALERNDIFKYYVEFSFGKKEDTISDFDMEINESNGFSVGKLANIVLSKTSAKYCAIRTVSKEYETTIGDFTRDYYPESPYSYQIDLDKEILGMSLSFTFRTLDNVQVDYYVSQQDESLVNNIYKYCDSDGEIEQLLIAIASSIDSTDGVMTFPSNGQNWDKIGQASIDSCNAYMSNVMDIISKKPKIKTNGFFTSDNITTCFALQKLIYKDNREILQSHIQFEYCSDNKNIIVTQKLIQYCSFYSNVLTDMFKVYLSTSETYNLNDTEAKGTHVSYVAVSISQSVINRYSSLIQIDLQSIAERLNIQVSDIKSWCIADTDGEILLAINGNRTSVFVNLLKSRDTNIYYSQQDRTIVGNIDSLNQLDANVAAYEASLNEGE